MVDGLSIFFFTKGGKFIEKKYYRTNEKIRIDRVRLIDADGAQLGVRTIGEALNIAQNRGLDLVEVAPMATPPVCKILEFSKFLYEMQKKTKEQRKKRSGDLKEIKVRQKISAPDLQVKINRMTDFINDRNKIKFSVVFFGREMAHVDLGWVLMNKVIQGMDEIAKIDEPPKMIGHSIVVIFSPKK